MTDYRNHQVCNRCGADTLFAATSDPIRGTKQMKCVECGSTQQAFARPKKPHPLISCLIWKLEKGQRTPQDILTLLDDYDIDEIIAAIRSLPGYYSVDLGAKDADDIRIILCNIVTERCTK